MPLENINLPHPPVHTINSRGHFLGHTFLGMLPITHLEVIADTSPRILNLILDHALGKPPEQIHQEQVVFILGSIDDNKAQDAVVVDTGQFSLPEGSEEE